MTTRDRMYCGVGSEDWLFAIYIMKWADFWLAPTWLFVLLWVMFVFKVLYLFSPEHNMEVE